MNWTSFQNIFVDICTNILAASRLKNAVLDGHILRGQND